MKLQINGFDIEINSDEANISMKVMDANGTELSNNTYSQSTEAESEEIQDVDMPEVDEVETEEEVVEDDVEETEATEDDATEEETEEPAEGNEGDAAIFDEDEETGESYEFKELPDFETFKESLKK